VASELPRVLACSLCVMRVMCVQYVRCLGVCYLGWMGWGACVQHACAVPSVFGCALGVDGLDGLDGLGSLRRPL
jgi:hypothetical protein